MSGIDPGEPWRITSEQQLRELLGQDLDCPQTLVIDQGRIDRFAEAIDDHQWIHVDPVRARTESPFGATVAHGFLTLSMLTWFLERTVVLEGGAMGINYGLDKVRFVQALRVDTSLAGRLRLIGLDEHDWGVHLTWDVTLTEAAGPRPADGGPAAGRGAEDWARPVLAARWLTRWYTRA